MISIAPQNFELVQHRRHFTSGESPRQSRPERPIS